MADFTTTTNLNLKKPAVGGSSDKWGEYLNADLDTIDTEIQSLKTASTSRSLESLSNVLDLTPTTGQVLQYDTANWKAATVTIPEDIDDLGNVTVSSPADGQVLAYNISTSRWENQSAGAATIPDGTITTAKLSTSLQGQVNLILQTTGTPTDDQILRYNATTSRWEFQDLPGGTISSLSDTDVSAISNKDVLVYNSTSGDWVSRPLAIADVTGLQAQLDAKLESSDLSVSSLTDTTITTTADNSVLVYDALDSKWKNEGPSTARSSLGLAIGTDVQAYDADTTKNDVSNTFSVNQIISVSDNTNAALRITQTGTGNALVVEDDSGNPDSSPFVVDANGRVLSGYGLAQSPFSVTSRFQASGTDYEAGYAALRFSADSQSSLIGFSKSRNSTVGSQGIVQSQDDLGTFRFSGSDGANFIQAASITAAVDGTPGANDMPGRLVFSTTADGSSSPTERMRIDSSGNVGIGTTSPNSKLNVSTNSSDAAVTITQTGSGNALVVEDSANPDSTPFVVDSTGRLLVGTSSARGIGAGTFGAFEIEQAGISIASITTNSNDTEPGYLTFGKSRGTSVGSNTIVQSGDRLGEIRFAGADGSDILSLGAAIQVFVDGTPGANDMPGRLVFSTTADGAASPTERMRIDSSGNVGIGTSSPAQKLDVTGNINATGALTLGTALAIAEGGTGVTSLGSLDAADLGSGAATDGYVLTADGAGGAAWEAASGGGGGTTAYIEHSDTISDSFTVSSGTNRMYIGGTTFSGTISVAGRLVIVGGEANFTGTINTTGVLAILGVP